MQHDLEQRVARAICKSAGHDPDLLMRWNEPQWARHMHAARAAMAATREIDAEALRLAGDDVAWSRMRAADWLQQRAIGAP